MAGKKDMKKALRTANEVKADFDAKGISVAEWSRTHGFRSGIVYQVLSGDKKGRRGEAHRAAVLLGLKRGIVIDQGRAADE
jgi:gp16 family phage-associated protein